MKSKVKKELSKDFGQMYEMGYLQGYSDGLMNEKRRSIEVLKKLLDKIDGDI